MSAQPLRFYQMPIWMLAVLVVLGFLVEALVLELLLLRIFEVKLVQDPEFEKLRGAFAGGSEAPGPGSRGSLR